MMKTAVFWTALLTIFGVTNGMIAHKEAAIRNGVTMYFELAPRDPRSLMQGDYMALRYSFLGNEDSIQATRGKIVVTLDAKKVATFVRVYEGEELDEGEYVVRYVQNRWQPRVGPDSFF